jgi:ribosomal protein L7/L12
MPAAYQAGDLQQIFQRINDRIRAIEEHLVVLSEKAGVAYSLPSEGAPKEVVELARAGKTLEAIKLYRELTNADFESAKAAVEAI